MNNARYFSDNNTEYATYRPTYPRELVDYLAEISPSLGCALDVGCGTGQLSVLLGDRFQKVIATDASESQISNALPHKNVTYYCTTAENSKLPSESIDLITVSQAAHWLNLDDFYREAKRIAKPQAVIALITYGVLQIDDPIINIIFQAFYYQILAKYWPAERKHVDEHYQHLPFPFPKIESPKLKIEKYWTLAELLGYIGTWSAVKVATEQEKINPIDILADKWSEHWHDPQRQQKITWPLTVIAGKTN